MFALFSMLGKTLPWKNKKVKIAKKISNSENTQQELPSPKVLRQDLTKKFNKSVNLSGNEPQVLKRYTN